MFKSKRTDILEKFENAYQDISKIMDKNRTNSEKWDSYAERTVETLGNLKDSKVLFIATLISSIDYLLSEYPNTYKDAKDVVAKSHELMKSL